MIGKIGNWIEAGLKESSGRRKSESAQGVAQEREDKTLQVHCYTTGIDIGKFAMGERKEREDQLSDFQAFDQHVPR